MTRRGHNPEDPASEKSHVLPLKQASADGQGVVQLIVEVIEKAPLDEGFLIDEFHRGRETHPTASGDILHSARPPQPKWEVELVRANPATACAMESSSRYTVEYTRPRRSGHER